jgi:hypothetical protein
MSKRAFALKENRDLDSVGSIVINASGTDLNVRDALKRAPGGIYVTDQPDEIAALDGYDPVKGVPVPEPKADKPKGKPDGKGE